MVSVPFTMDWRNGQHGFSKLGQSWFNPRFVSKLGIYQHTPICLSMFILYHEMEWELKFQAKATGNETLGLWIGGLDSISMYFLTLVFSKVSGAHQNPTGQTTFFPSKLTTELRIFLTFGPFAAPRSSPHPSKLLRSARYQCTSLSNFIPGSSNWTLVDCVGWEPPE